MVEKLPSEETEFGYCCGPGTEATIMIKRRPHAAATFHALLWLPVLGTEP